MMVHLQDGFGYAEFSGSPSDEEVTPIYSYVEPPQENHILYRLYNESGAVLYIGITKSVPKRFEHHAQSKPWWPSVADVRLTAYESRADLLLAEAVAIRVEYPIHNMVFPPLRHYLRKGKKGKPDPSRRRRVATILSAGVEL